VKESPLEGLAI
jgi:hypothetical protein